MRTVTASPFSPGYYSNRMQRMRCPGRPTSPLRASRVLNTSAPTANLKARSNRMATNETTALECSERGSTTHKPATSFACPAPIAKARSNRRATANTTALKCKPRYATNAAKLATARTGAPFFSCSACGLEVAHSPAIMICVPTTYALCLTAKKSQKVNTNCPGAECQTCKLFGDVAKDSAHANCLDVDAVWFNILYINAKASWTHLTDVSVPAISLRTDGIVRPVPCTP